MTRDSAACGSLGGRGRPTVLMPPRKRRHQGLLGNSAGIPDMCRSGDGGRARSADLVPPPPRCAPTIWRARAAGSRHCVRVRWVELLKGTGARLVFRQGVAPGRLDELERRLGAPLPADLRALLSETDGFDDADGQWEVAWSVGRIGSETHRFRSDGLLDRDDVAFGDNGAGDPFCINVAGTVNVVSPIDGERVLLAESLSDFWDGWFRGRITT